MPNKQVTLSIDLLHIDRGTQSRLKIDEYTVERYAGLLKDSGTEWPFPPLIVFHDGSEYFVSSGFHRFLAAQREKRGSVPCEVRPGTAADAKIFGMTANDHHGLPMTRADKRACVEWLLDNPPKRTQAEIAQLAGVVKRTVQMIVADRVPAVAKPPSNELNRAQIAPETPRSDKTQTAQTAAANGDASTACDATEAAETANTTPELAQVRAALTERKIKATDEQAAQLTEHVDCLGDLLDSVADGRQTLDRAIATGEVPEPTTEQLCDRHNKTIEAFCRDLTKYVEANKPDVEWLDQGGRWEVLVQKVKNGLETVRSAKSVVCPACNGDGCKTCLQLGYLPKVMASQVAK